MKSYGEMNIKTKDKKGLLTMKSNSRLKIIVAMLIWSTLGVFIKGIELSSIEIALFRAIIGSIFLILLGLITKQEFDKEVIKKNLGILLFSGLALGINWILLFESYKNTTISNAILSYYMAPIIIVILCAAIFKEKVALKKLLCIIGAMIGLFLILYNDGAVNSGGYNHIKGILYGLSAALFYALVVILNKFIKDLSGFKITVIQLLVSAMVILPITLLTATLEIMTVSIKSFILLAIVGILHTGIAYLLYFSSIKDVEGQSIAVLSYIDPIFALIISWVLLGEKMNIIQICGGLLILFSAYLSEHN